MSNKKIIEYINSWQEKEIISKKQKKLMIEDLENENSTSHFFKIIAIIGALFIGIGALLMISSNWEVLPKFIKLILILLMPILGIGGGYYLSFVKEEYQKIGNAFIFLGTLLIGASLALLGQLYNLSGSITGLLFWWLLLSLPVALVFKYRSLAFISSTLLYTGIFSYIIDASFWNLDEEVITLIFSVIPVVLIISSYSIRKIITKEYENMLKILEIVSIKVLFLALFISIFDDSLYFLGESFVSGIFQNLLFLGTIFFVMWFSNKKYNSVLRNSTFFWLGGYMIVKYFSWLWNYMSIGIFFLLFGIFLILLVFGYIKGVKYLESKKNE
jgi:uncharacterized membrane protein